MKSYPKVPRYNHEVVPDDFYRREDIILLEKTDGQNLRVFLYDERFPDMYSDDLDEFNPQDGDIFIGTKKAVQGKLSDNPEEFKGNFNRLLTYLKDNLDAGELRSIHSEYESPVVLFGEHMIQHSLDYDYRESPPPALLGFDVFLHKDYTPKGPGNPYNETFEGFLSFEEVESIFEQIGLETIRVIETSEKFDDPESVDIPSSNYADVQAEGIVFRSDSTDRRTKRVNLDFKERMKKAWGIREDQAETGEELVAAWYLTNGRIRKYIHKYAQKNETIDAGKLAETIVYDIWIEEWREISSLDVEITPQNLYDHAIERIEEILNKMETNAYLNDSDILSLWDAHTDIDPSTTGRFDVEPEELKNVEESVQTYDSVEEGLIEELLDSDRILLLSKEIADREDREIGRWTIPEVKNQISDQFWESNGAILANLRIAYNPFTINELLVDATVKAINTYVDGRPNEDVEPSSFEDREVLDSFFK